MKPVASDLCLVWAGLGRITLQSSAEYLDQPRVRIDRTDTSEAILTKPRAVASETIREIALENDLQFA